MKIPLVGLGTYKLLGDQATRIVKEALDVGYRHFDTAHVYGNHEAVGRGLKGFHRKELFITSKLSIEQVDDAKILSSTEKACEQALNELGLDYLDLYLIHWPERTRPLNSILSAMNQLVKQGKVRHVGVSNYTIHHLQDGLDAGLTIEANQVEFHPYLFQKKLLDFCNKKGIRLIAHRSFGKGELMQIEPLFDQIGKRYGKSGAQVILRWTVQRNIPVIPKSSSKERLIENFSIFDFALTKEEMEALDQLHQDKRYCDPDWEEFNY